MLYGMSWKTEIIACFLGCMVMGGQADHPVSVSGVYPHLAMYNNENECGTGAVVPWAGRLWVITYAPHAPQGSSDKLYEITPDLHQVVRPESIGGTPANRMIHAESEQLLIGPYVIDADRTLRVIPYDRMFGRLTGTARHLTDPATKVYYATMEEGFYEVDVHTLEVTELWADDHVARNSPEERGGRRFARLPGYHGKGLYSGQGLLIYSNNGERGGQAQADPRMASGCLAAWDGLSDEWSVMRRNQFTDVTGPGGILGNSDPERDPVWSIGWDHRSLLLMVLNQGAWNLYRLPKSSHSYDGAHGWNTEWPRIREIGEDDLLMTMHGAFWRFPANFNPQQSAGLEPRSNYLKVVGDFSLWQGRIALGCDDSAKSEFLNKRHAKGSAGGPGQSNSNLWFIEPERLDRLGPVIGRGAVWMNDAVAAGEKSDPYLFSGYEERSLSLAHAADHPVRFIIEVDREGNGSFTALREVTVPPGRLTCERFTDGDRGAWVRLVALDAAPGAYACFQYAAVDARPAESGQIFNGIAGPGNCEALGGIVYGRGDNKRTLGLAAMRADSNGVRDIGFYELDGELRLQRSQDQHAMAWAKRTYPMDGTGVSADQASALVVDDAGRRWRFPKAETEGFDTPGIWPAARICREVCTERDLLNLCGIFYELPAENAGGFAKARAIATHGRHIHDYTSFRGLMVISGLDADGPASDRVIRSEDGLAAVWVGVIDDLWDFGKPRGVGGPWKDTVVRPGEPSDPYLMTGFDRKRLTLSQTGAPETRITLELDITGFGAWQPFETYLVEEGIPVTIDLDDVRAYWLRVRPDQSCTATAWLEYR